MDQIHQVEWRDCTVSEKILGRRLIPRKPIARHFDFPLKPGRRQAALVVEDAQCDIYETFDEARTYLSENIDWILQNFGETHHVGREDIMIVSHSGQRTKPN